MQNSSVKYIGIILIILMIGYLLFNNVNIPFSVLSESKNVIFENGKVYNIVLLSIDKITSTTYLFKPSDYTLQNGSIVKGTKNVSILFTPENPICIYSLRAEGEPTIFGYNLNLWKIYYMTEPTITSNIKIKIDNEEKILDGSGVGNKVIFFNKNNNGILEITTQGALMSKERCPSPSGLIVLNDNGRPKIVSQAKYIELKNAKFTDCLIVCSSPLSPFCFSCWQEFQNLVLYGSQLPQAENFKTFNALLFADPAGTETKTTLKGVMPLNSATNPVLTIKADQNYFDSVIFSEPATKPKIVSLTCSNALEEKTTTLRAILENTGNIDAVYNLRITTNLGSIKPTSTSLLVQAKQQNFQDYIWYVPSVSADTTYTITLEACSDLGCDRKTCSNKILDVPPWPWQNDTNVEYCGNGKCSTATGENYINCPQDCQKSQQTKCPPNSQLKNNECICNEGYLRKFDVNTGEMYCEKENNLLLYGAIVVILLLLIIILKRRWKYV